MLCIIESLRRFLKMKYCRNKKEQEKRRRQKLSKTLSRTRICKFKKTTSRSNKMFKKSDNASKEHVYPFNWHGIYAKSGAKSFKTESKLSHVKKNSPKKTATTKFKQMSISNTKFTPF